MFLRGETVQHLTCSNRVADAIQDQVMENERGEVLTDVASGLRLIDSGVQLDVAAVDATPTTGKPLKAIAADWFEGTITGTGMKGGKPGKGKSSSAPAPVANADDVAAANRARENLLAELELEELNAKTKNNMTNQKKKKKKK